jgi:hypothetical protein
MSKDYYRENMNLTYHLSNGYPLPLTTADPTDKVIANFCLESVSQAKCRCQHVCILADIFVFGICRLLGPWCASFHREVKSLTNVKMRKMGLDYTMLTAFQPLRSEATYLLRYI